MKPLIVINFKAYEEGLNKKGLKIIELIRKYENVIVSVPSPIISLVKGYEIVNNACVNNLKVFAQHVDPVSQGAHTGSVTAQEIKMAGAIGSLINHSEKRIPFESIKKVILELKKYGLKSILCCQDLDEALKFKELNPDYIAYEPPELIGGDVSVITKSDIVKEIVVAVKPVKVLVGAGVKSRIDIAKSIELGAKGVLIASGIIKAKNTEEKIKELIDFK